MSDPHALWLMLTNFSLVLVMVGGAVALGASFRRGKVKVAATPASEDARDEAVPTPVIHDSGAAEE